MSMPQQPSNLRVILFTVILSFVSAFILAALSSALAEPKVIAKELDRSKQMLIAARILTHENYFLTRNAEGKYESAKYVGGGRLESSSTKERASDSAILEVYKKRLIPLLTNDKGEISTFKEAGIDESEYLSEYKKIGYYKPPYKLFYKILPNPTAGEKVDPKPVGYIIPVNGFGLWDAIYGYLAVEPNGNTVIGISWYDQKETPGLGANIADAPWQSEFPGKLIFQEGPTGKTDFKTAQLGITVVKGKVSEVLGDVPKAKSAVDGMAGATLTGNGVTDAYREVLAPYRPFLIKLNEESVKSAKGSEKPAKGGPANDE